MMSRRAKALEIKYPSRVEGWLDTCGEQYLIVVIFYYAKEEHGDRYFVLILVLQYINPPPFLYAAGVPSWSVYNTLSTHNIFVTIYSKHFLVEFTLLLFFSNICRSTYCGISRYKKKTAVEQKFKILRVKRQNS